ncbi:MAG: hypothetical protein KDK07_08845 [Bauldia sp.]|nr:hypothetical protein [Bauldia sp.]
MARLLVALTVLVVAVLPVRAADAPSYFYAERGHWTVMNYPAACRAVNRPPVDFNQTPFNALQITVRPGDRISIDVFFWPAAIDPAADNALAFGFGAGTPLILPATAAMGDYMLASADSPELWGRLQKAKMLTAKVKDDPKIALAFSLDQIGWVLTALQTCTRVLPKE